MVLEELVIGVEAEVVAVETGVHSTNARLTMETRRHTVGAGPLLVEKAGMRGEFNHLNVVGKCFGLNVQSSACNTFLLPHQNNISFI